MQRITQKDLERKVSRINELTKSPMTSYTRTIGGKLQANIGNYHIAGAYGGVKLERICNEGGGVSEISRDGYGTKRQLATFLDGMLRGLEAHQE